MCSRAHRVQLLTESVDHHTGRERETRLYFLNQEKTAYFAGMNLVHRGCCKLDHLAAKLEYLNKSIWRIGFGLML